MAFPALPSVATSAGSSWSRRLTTPLVAALVLAIFYYVLLVSLRDKSAGFDEPGHATAGVVYWKYNDYRIDPENGNLSKRWIALPFLFTSEQFPEADAAGWRHSNTWLLADDWFNRLGNDTSAMLARGRAMSALVAVALGAAVWRWSWQLFGPIGAMLSLVVYVLNPAMLANGGLMTSDTPAALGFLLSLWAVSRLLERVTPGRMVAAILAIAFLFLAKMSAVLLLPMAAVLVAIRVADGRPLRIGAMKILTRRASQLAAFAIVTLVQAVGVVALVWAFYGFRYEAFSPSSPVPHRFNHPWEWALALPEPLSLVQRLELDPTQQNKLRASLIGADGSGNEWTYDVLAQLDRARSELLTAAQNARLDRTLAEPPSRTVPKLIWFARKHRLLPEAFLYGYAHVWKTSGKLAAFFNGEIRETGWRTFFPYVFAVKTPLAFLAIVALTAGIAVVRWRKQISGRAATRARLIFARLYPTLPLLVLLTVYWTFAITSHLNIGHRHLLPVYPPLFVLCGSVGVVFSTTSLTAFAPAALRRLRFIVVGLVVLLATETACRFPNYLAYFNGLIRPSQAYRHLIDSSLDWGQELPAIARYVREHPGELSYLAYFGVGSPAYYHVKARLISGFPVLEQNRFPPLKPMVGTTGPAVLAFLREHPDYDPDLLFRLDGAEQLAVLLIQRSSVLRLGAGRYVVSASRLQPIYTGKADTYWNEAHERAYQQIKREVQPFLSEDRQAKLAAVSRHPVNAWQLLFEDYFDLRFARLASFLRAREPDDEINYSVLVYRLTEADLTRALDGPAP